MEKSLYKLKSIVIEGEANGRKIGFKTANVRIVDYVNDLPKYGVYAGYVKVGNRTHKGVFHIGPAETFDRKEVTLEVHILDFAKNIYGFEIEVELIRMLRKIKKFNNEEELKAQIAKDCEAARSIL